MPTKPMQVCAEPGCSTLAAGYRCTTHAVTARKASHANSSRIYDTKRWKVMRFVVLNGNPWCQTPGCLALATDVDHIVAIRHGGEPWDYANLQALCRPCHARKTAGEIGLGKR